MPTPDALPAAQLPYALWDAGVRPAGVMFDEAEVVTPFRYTRYKDALVLWEPHRTTGDAWGVLAWARARAWDTEVEWVGGHGEVRITVDGHRTITQWTEPTEAAECEAICRAVLRAAQGWATP